MLISNNHPNPPRAGFTLVELLLVISILAVLSGLAAVTLRSAREDAQGAATLATFGQIKTLFRQRFEDYEVRKPPIPLRNYVNNRAELAVLKERIIADLINVEFPRDTIDSFTDNDGNFRFEFPSSEFQLWANSALPANKASELIAALIERKPALIWRIEAEVQRCLSEGGSPSNAELLYMIVRFSEFNDAPGTEYISDGSIADTDGDGLLEIVDRWGDPARFEIFKSDGLNRTDLRDLINTSDPLPQQDLVYELFSDNL